MSSFGTGGLATEWLVLVECSSPACERRRLRELLEKNPDWSILLPLAEDHGVLGLLAGRLLGDMESHVPEAARQKVHEKQRALLLSALGLNAELFRLLETFSAAHLETVVVKGPALSTRAHGDSCMRQYEDLDLLVRHRDASRFTELMISEGYAPKIPLSAIRAGKVPGEYVFRCQSTKRRIELHTEQTLRYFPLRLSVEEFFERKMFLSFDAHSVPTLCAEDELVLICIHGAKHFWERLMWVADVAGLVSRQENFDWDRAFGAAHEAGAMRMLSVGLLLALEIFRIELPREVEKVIRSDRAAVRLAGEISEQLPSGNYVPRALFARALFRVRMRGGALPGVAYLLRLTLSPTEEDWAEDRAEARPGFFKTLRRPLRLARKYWRSSEE